MEGGGRDGCEGAAAGCGRGRSEEGREELAEHEAKEARAVGVREGDGREGVEGVARTRGRVGSEGGGARTRERDRGCCEPRGPLGRRVEHVAPLARCHPQHLSRIRHHFPQLFICTQWFLFLFCFLFLLFLILLLLLVLF